jgi:hypothetical protein
VYQSRRDAPSIDIPRSFVGSVRVTVPERAILQEGTSVKRPEEIEQSNMCWKDNVHSFTLGPIGALPPGTHDTMWIRSPTVEGIKLGYDMADEHVPYECTPSSESPVRQAPCFI